MKKPEKKEKGPPIFDQKQAQHMIRQLGIHGFDKKQKDEAMVDLLVELGAKVVLLFLAFYHSRSNMSAL